MAESPDTFVREFHRAFGLVLNERPTSAPLDLAQRRIRLHEEETAELAEAIEGGDLTEIAHELADVVYVAYGTAATYGIDLDAVLAAVHRANMTKLGDDGRPIMDNGKVTKGPHYQPPDIAAALTRTDNDLPHEQSF